MFFSLIQFALLITQIECIAKPMEPSTSVQIKLTDTPTSDPIPSDFVSFSIEISGTSYFMGTDVARPKQSYVTLLNNLHQKGTAGPNLRIGGNSAESSWWDPEHKPPPIFPPPTPRIVYDISSDDLVRVVNTAKAVNGSVVFGTTMLLPNDVEWARNHIEGISTYVGWDYVRAIEIGNEPDVFYLNGVRGDHYSFTQYDKEYSNYSNYLHKTVPNLPVKIFQGATWCTNNMTWAAGFPDYVNTQAAHLNSISYHRYPLSHCHSNKTLTLEELLLDRSSAGQVQFLKPLVDTSHAAGLPFYIGEANSISCGGYTGVSDVFGVTLWAVDFLFNLAAVNIKGINFHGGSSVYSAIIYQNAAAEVPDVRPLYYALWLFSQSTKNNARLLSTQVTTTNPLIKSWAVKADNGVTTVVVIHKDITSTEAASVFVTSPKAYTAPAELSLLLSSGGVHSKYGISFAKQTFDNSKDGKPIGVRSPTLLHPTKNGGFQFTLQPGTIAVLELPLQ